MRADRLRGADTAGQGFSLRSLLRNASYLFSSSMFVSVLAMFQGIVVTRVLGPSLYGLWGVVLGLVGTVKAFFSAPTAVALTHYLVRFQTTEDRSQLDLLIASAIALDFALGLGTFVVIAGFAVALGQHAGSEAATTAVYLVCGGTVVLAFPGAVWTSIMRDDQRYAALGAVPAAVSVVQFVLIAVAAGLHRLGLHEMAWIFLAVEGLRGVVSLVMLHQSMARAYGLRLHRLPFLAVVPRWREVRGLWTSTGAMYLSTCVSSVAKQADILILSAFRPSAEVGCYRLAKNLMQVLTQVGGSLAQVMYQDLNELLAQRRARELAAGLRRFNRKWPALVGLGLLLVALLAHPLVVTLYGAVYAPAVWVFRLQLLSGWAITALFWTPSLVWALGDYWRYLAIQACICLPSVLGMALGSWLGGAAGLSVANAVMWWLLLGSLAWHGIRLLDRTDGEPPAAAEASLAAAG